MKNEVTVIIPTHERHRVLERAIDYYSQINSSVLIVDSSQEFLDKVLPENIQYLHLPNLFFGDKIYTALNEVSTPYSCLCADDDFLSESGLYFGIRYLKENKDYVSVQGNYVHFSYSENLNDYHPVYAETIGPRKVDANSPVDRLMESIGMGQSFIYALHHTEVLLKCLRVTLNMQAVTLVETGISIGSPLYGKHIILPVFWMARDKNRYSEYISEKGNNYSKNDKSVVKNISNLNMVIGDFHSYLETDQGVQFRKNFINITIDIFHDSSVCSEFFDEYFKNKSLNKVKFRKKVSESFIKTTIKKNTPNFILNFFYEKINTKVKIAEKQRLQFKKSSGYPWSSDEAQEDWNKMKKAILKHGDLVKN
jgi:glycosyltransferase domain-containing protein